MKKHHDRSDSSHAILDQESRKRKATKIKNLLSSHADIKKAKVLDVGTGAGHIAQQLATHFKETVSVDVVDERRVKKGYKFVKVKDEKLPFEDGSFDIVISNHIIEHVPHQQTHIDEAIRVLKKGGVMYLATPNRYWFMDPHYRIYLINWMPRKLATFYLKLVRGKQWDVYPISLYGLSKLHANRFSSKNAVAEILKNPDDYSLDTMKPLLPITKRTPTVILKTLATMSPTLVLVLKKR